MSTYSQIKGTFVASSTSDPSPLQNGVVFYNSTSNTFKLVKNVSGTPTAQTITTATFNQ
jgi:hypothetical protein